MAERIYLLAPTEYGVPARIVASGLARDDDGPRESRASRWLHNAKEERLLSREELMATEEGRLAIAAFEGGDYSAFDEHDRRETAAFDNPELDRLAAEGDATAQDLVEQGYPWRTVREFLAHVRPKASA
jgi:hypothetical protein